MTEQNPHRSRDGGGYHLSDEEAAHQRRLAQAAALLRYVPTYPRETIDEWMLRARAACDQGVVPLNENGVVIPSAEDYRAVEGSES
jgi:hypothetical protein